MAKLESLMSDFSGLVWGAKSDWPVLILLLFGTHLFLTFRLGFLQRHIGRMIKVSLKKDSAEGDVSQFGALTTRSRRRSAQGIFMVWLVRSRSADRGRCSGCG
jgi:AGCS family alanine or glycine:cation symporter